MSYIYKYPRPMVTVDAVVFGLDPNQLKVLLVKRAGEPYRGCWALPGGFVADDETLEMAVARELVEETGIDDLVMYPLRGYSHPERDPRGRNITFAFISLHLCEPNDTHPGDDASEAVWHDTDNLPITAFDHDEIILDAIDRLRELVLTSDILFSMLPSPFSPNLLKSALEIIFGGPVDDEKLLGHFVGIGLIEAETVINDGETVVMYSSCGNQ